jgi:hypothetical protein
MPQNTKLANEQWDRYIYCRDTAHIDYLTKARKCEDFVNNKQWDPAVKAKLNAVRRPAITINKILVTLSSILGEQIDLRTEIAFKGRYGAPSGNADTLTKVFRYISDKTFLDWVRSELFADGVITSRGFVDVRMNFDTNIAGNVQIVHVNPRNVMPDPDASEYDPDQWNDVIVTKWHTADDIEFLYSAEDAKILRSRGVAARTFGYDSVDVYRDKFGGTPLVNEQDMDSANSTSRFIRTIDRQYKKLTKVKSFINVRTGDRERIPATWDRNKIALMLDQYKGMVVLDEHLDYKIRWTITAEDVVLHDDWSPYKHFTIIPYFPYFRYGSTIGLIENLLDPQELLNKTVSQELHVVNTTANSGWKTKQGNLKNMTPDELEERGAETGLVLELDDITQTEKIQPNQVPSGLERISMKAEGYIKSVSNRGDAQMGMTRADVSADQIEANNNFGDVGLRKPMDNLKHTDRLIARNVLDLIQEYYTDPRIMEITNAELEGEQETITINWPDPETGQIQNDVTMGEYDVTVISQTVKPTLDASQFEQALMMREKLGIPIPDEALIQNSNLIDKTGIIRKLKEQAQSPEAMEEREIQKAAKKLELAELKSKTSKNEADTTLKQSKAAHAIAQTQDLSGDKPQEQQEMELEAQKHQQEMQMQREKHDQEMQLEREKMQLKAELDRKAAEDKRLLARAQAVAAMKQTAQNPNGKPQPQGASNGGTS